MKGMIRILTAGSVECLEPRLISFNYGKVPHRLAIVLVEHRAPRWIHVPVSQQHLLWFWQKCSKHNRTREKNLVYHRTTNVNSRPIYLSALFVLVNSFFALSNSMYIVHAISLITLSVNQIIKILKFYSA